MQGTYLNMKHDASGFNKLVEKDQEEEVAVV
jgi:hypothetical protein